MGFDVSLSEALASFKMHVFEQRMFLQDAQAHLKIVGHMQTRATSIVRAYSWPLLHKTMINVSMINTPPDKSAYFCFGIYFLFIMWEDQLHALATFRLLHFRPAVLRN